jgi:NADH pyrophosphatase NudC (nudix superfamily)
LLRRNAKGVAHMSTSSERNWFQRTCPHLWRVVSSEDIYDILDPTVIIGVRATRRCLICGSITKTRLR